MISVPAKQSSSTAAIKMETNRYLLLIVVVTGLFPILISQFRRNPDGVLVAEILEPGFVLSFLLCCCCR